MDHRRNEIQLLLKDVKSLPTLPGILTKLLNLADNNSATVQEMARVVSSDQVLSSKVLRLVNSPFYGFPGRVSTVSHALILLGVNVVKSLVLSTSIFDIMEKNTVGLWEHSLGSAVAASIISKKLGLPDAEEISTATLLHDIGKVIVKIKLEEDFEKILSISRDREISTFEAEREHFETDHAEIGGWVAKIWHLPDKLLEPIACHHDVESSTVHQIKTAVVHLADVLTKASGFGFSGDDFVPQIQPVAWKCLEMNESILAEIVGELDEKLVEIKNFSLEIQGGNDGKD